MVFLERLRSAINAYTKGHRPLHFAHEWEGSIVSLIPKVPAALLMTDERPIACEYSKYIIATTIYNDRLSGVMEDFQLLDDVQEGFRRHRSTKRQVSKLQGLLAQHRRDKSQWFFSLTSKMLSMQLIIEQSSLSLRRMASVKWMSTFSVKCILENSFQLVIHLVNQLRVFFGAVYFKETHPARTSSTSPSTRHIRWCEPVGGAASLRAWTVHQDLVDLRMIPRFTQAAVMPSPLCAHWLVL
jgi:hypothetical protein